MIQMHANMPLTIALWHIDPFGDRTAREAMCGTLMTPGWTHEQLCSWVCEFSPSMSAGDAQRWDEAL